MFPDNASIAEAMKRVAELLEVEEGASDRVRSWRAAVRSIEASARPITEIVRQDGVEGLHHLGLDYVLAGRVADVLREERFPFLDRLEARSACGSVFERVPGIGPKLAREVREVLGVESLSGLARAARDGTLSEICGFGPRRTRLVASALAPIERPARSEPTESTEGQLELWGGQ